MFCNPFFLFILYCIYVFHPINPTRVIKKSLTIPCLHPKSGLCSHIPKWVPPQPTNLGSKSTPSSAFTKLTLPPRLVRAHTSAFSLSLSLTIHYFLSLKNGLLSAVITGLGWAFKNFTKKRKFKKSSEILIFILRSYLCAYCLTGNKEEYSIYISI